MPLTGLKTVLQADVSQRRALQHPLPQPALERGPGLAIVGLAVAAGPGGGIGAIHAGLEAGVGAKRGQTYLIRLSNRVQIK
jgi:hypothetical protein